MNILLIEDNPGDVLLVEEYVSDVFLKAEVTHRSTFQKALELLHRGHPFDIILLDLSLPDSEGMDLVVEILQIADSTPVIILTGYTNLEFSVKSLSKGISDYLLKDDLSAALLYKSMIYSIERSLVSERIRESLREKEMLLSEIHHRVKNNLAIVSSLMEMQAFGESNKEVERKLLDSTLRIKTMASIHEVLYESGSFSKLDFSEIIEKLLVNIDNAINIGQEISNTIRKEPIDLNINQAVPCSMIINEVLTNIYKHAFPDRDNGKIDIELSEKENWLFLKISDNGVGLPHDFNPEEYNSLGIMLIQTLVAQLHGEYTYKGSGKGTTFELKFEKSDSAGISSTGAV